MPFCLAESQQVLDDLAPEKEESPERIAEMPVPGELDDSLGEIVVNLAAHLSLDLIDDLIGVGYSQVALGDLRCLEELPVAVEDLVEAAAFAGNLVPRDF